jgi:hypothetical protein
MILQISHGKYTLFYALIYFGLRALMLKFGEVQNILDVLAQYEILGFCRSV